MTKIMVRFPNPRILLLMALAGMIALALVSFPWVRDAVFLLPVGHGDDECSSPELLRSRNDLRIFITCTGRAGFLGNTASLHPLVAKNYVESIIGEDTAAAIPASTTVDFASIAGNEVGLEFANKALKINGITAIQLESSDASSPLLKIPPNSQRICIRPFVSTVTAIQKITCVDLGARKIRRQPMGRRILAVPESKKDALNGLEDAALEPPSKAQLRRRLGRRRYLSDLLGDSLAEYPRRVFVDVGPPGRAGSEDWFATQYPTRDLDFEIIRVDVDDLGISGGDGNSPVASGGVTEWLWQNVREEDYVVMKAEADAVEEMVKGHAIGLVDELFLECRNQWQKGKGGNKSRRAYWECLALYGKLRDEGVAVHQWWD